MMSKNVYIKVTKGGCNTKHWLVHNIVILLYYQLPYKHKNKACISIKRIQNQTVHKMVDLTIFLNNFFQKMNVNRKYIR